MQTQMTVTYGKGFTPEVHVPLREKVERLQEELLKMPQADVQYLHSFEPGKYIRTMIAPPWTVIVGAEHKTPYKVRLEKGSIAVNIDEERLYVIPECGLMSNRVPKQLQEVKDDYALFLKEMKLNQVEMDKILAITHDLMDMPKEFFTELRTSKIEGTGLFATKSFKMWEVVCPCRLDGKRTPGGRFVNHSHKNNLMPIKIGEDIYAIASQDIYANEELLLNYRDMMFVNFGLRL